VREHRTIRLVRVALDAADLDRFPVCQASGQARILVRLSTRRLDELRRHALMLGPERVVDARVEAMLGCAQVIEQCELDVSRMDLTRKFREPVEIFGVRDELRYDHVVAGNKMDARHAQAQLASQGSGLALASSPAAQQAPHGVLLQGQGQRMALDVAERHRRLPDPWWSVEDDETWHPCTLGMRPARLVVPADSTEW
jgi:hypothetical protein